MYQVLYLSLVTCWQRIFIIVSSQQSRKFQ